MVIFLVLVLFLELLLSFLSFVSSIFSHIFSDTRTSQSGTGRFSTFFTYQGQVCMVFRYKINNVGILGRFIVFYLCFSYRLWTLTYLSLCFIHFDIIFLIMSSKLDLWIGLMKWTTSLISDFKFSTQLISTVFLVGIAVFEVSTQCIRRCLIYRFGMDFFILCISICLWQGLKFYNRHECVY